jgi:beta-lactamase superfamily II metal-dependent hydrolase
MAEEHVIAVDLATVRREEDGKKKVLTLLAWGDPVEVTGRSGDRLEVRVAVARQRSDGSIETDRVAGFIEAKGGIDPDDIVIEARKNAVLRLDFVDVQQGDASVIETPSGKTVLIDGGDNQLFARYLASRFRGTSAGAPKEIDCVLVSHGDADHFAGLSEIHESENDPRLPDHKRLFIHPRRVYHNGLVKRPSSRKEVEQLGATREVEDARGRKIRLVTGLEQDLLAVDTNEMNQPFRRWRKALEKWRTRGPILFRRLERGDDGAFDFLTEDRVAVEVLGPIPTRADGVEGLKFLGEPPHGPRIGHESVSTEDEGFGGLSPSHTINGHSVILRLTYGRFSFLFTGDLNDEAGRTLVRAHHAGKTLRSDVFKVPHHGSADFSGAFLRAVAPVVSIVSSGDESEQKEFIHPRATLMGALGRCSRVDEPLVFVTELAAFFSIEGFIDPRYHQLTDAGRDAIKTKEQVVDPEKRKRFFALSRAAFGIVMVRTDGERLLVYTNSAKVAMKEAYAYVINAGGEVEPAPVRKA